MRTIITPRDFRDINRHRERLEKTNYDNDEEEELDDYDDDGEAYEASEYAKEYEQPSYMQSPYYDGT